MHVVFFSSDEDILSLQVTQGANKNVILDLRLNDTTMTMQIARHFSILTMKFDSRVRFYRTFISSHFNFFPVCANSSFN